VWLGGQEVPLVHRCALRVGQHSEHHAAVDAGGALRCSFRWDESGFRFGHAAEAANRGPPRRATSATESGGANSARSATKPTTQPRHRRHDADALSVRSPESRSPTQALWALTAALARLSDVIAAASERDEFRRQDGGFKSG